jgi:PAS domain S-box-containing protein
VLAVLVLALGASVLLAWAFDVDAVKRIRPGFVPMTPASAVGLVIGGAALLLLLPQEPGTVRRRLATGLAAALVLFGAAVIVEYGLDLDLGLDRLLFAEAVAADLGQPRGRPAPNTAAAFLLSGIALLFFTVRVSRHHVAAHLAALAAGSFALQGLGGYLYDVEDYYRVGYTTPMALHTAVGLLLLALGILLARPRRGLMATVTAADFGGYVARRLLPAAILVPLALGLIRIPIVGAGAFSVAYTLALVVMFNAAAFVALVWWNAAALSRLDARRSAAEAARQRALAAADAERAYLRAVLDQMPAGVIIMDATGRMIASNRQGKAIWRKPLPERLEIADSRAYRGFHPDGRPYAPEEWPLARAVLRGEVVEGEEIEILRGDGTTGTIRASAAPVRGADGELIAGVVAFSDVTEERRAEREREEVMERLTLALEAGRMGMWEWDIQAGTVTWSRELEAIHGLEAGGFPGTFDAFRDQIHPEDRERVMSAIERAVRGEEPYHVEYRTVRADGGVLWLEAWGRVFRRRGGRPERMVGVCRDVTERKEAELASARLAAIVEASEDTIIGSTPDGIITTWNPGAERMYGYTAEEAVGRPLSMLVPPEIENDLPAILERLRRGERIEHYEARRMTKDGRRLDVSLAVSPIRNERGVVVGAATIARDITEQKRAAAERERLLERERSARAEADRRAREEAALRRAAEAVSATFTVEEVIRRIAESALEATTADGAFVQRIDAGAQEIEVVAAAGRPVPPLGERSAYRGSVTARAVERGKPEALARVRPGPRPAAGLERHCLDCAAVVVPLMDAGQPLGSLVLVRGPGAAPFREDEIARARTFGRLASLAFRKAHLLESSERRREELQRVLESRARLMRGFSHDVKNPLGAAEGQLALLEQGVLNGLRPEQREGVMRARRSIETALRLIDSLIELERTEAGHIHLEYAVTDVRAAARDVAEEYRAAAEAKGLALDIELPEELPLIRTDPDRVRQVLGNLVSNAVKYTERGGIRVRVAARSGPAAPGPGGWVAVDVSDTGPGIPKDKQEEVFGEFTRLEPGTGRGTGLGLAIGRHLARALGGDITLQSEAGRGATFTLWLPRDGGPGPVRQR